MEDQQSNTKNNLVRLKDALRRMAVSKSTFYRLQQRGLFPRPVKCGESARWLEADVNSFIEGIVATRNRCHQTSNEVPTIKTCLSNRQVSQKH